jgi:hypothetical protein
MDFGPKVYCLFLGCFRINLKALISILFIAKSYHFIMDRSLPDDLSLPNKPVVAR